MLKSFRKHLWPLQCSATNGSNWFMTMVAHACGHTNQIDWSWIWFQVEYEVEACGNSAGIDSDIVCVDNKKTSMVMPNGGYVIYGASHQHSGGIGSALYGEVIVNIFIYILFSITSCLLLVLYIIAVFPAIILILKMHVWWMELGWASHMRFYTSLWRWKRSRKRSRLHRRDVNLLSSTWLCQDIWWRDFSFGIQLQQHHKTYRSYGSLLHFGCGSTPTKAVTHANSCMFLCFPSSSFWGWRVFTVFLWSHVLKFSDT